MDINTVPSKGDCGDRENVPDSVQWSG